MLRNKELRMNVYEVFWLHPVSSMLDIRGVLFERNNSCTCDFGKLGKYLTEPCMNFTNSE